MASVSRLLYAPLNQARVKGDPDGGADGDRRRAGIRGRRGGENDCRRGCQGRLPVRQRVSVSQISSDRSDPGREGASVKAALRRSDRGFDKLGGGGRRGILAIGEAARRRGRG